MSRSRPESDSQNQSSGTFTSTWQAFMRSEWAKPIVLTGLTIPAVVSATYPLDVIQTLRQSGNTAAYRPRYIFPYFANHWRLLVRGYFATFTQAGAKNAVLANRDNVHVRLKDGISTEEDVVNVHGEIDLPLRKKVTVTLGATTILAAGDVLATNYWANIRLAAQLGMNPGFNSYWDRLRFAYTACGSRYAGIYIGSLGIIAGGTLMRDPIEAILPVREYGVISPLVAGILPGLMTGPLGNFWNVIRVNQMMNMNPATYKVPSMWHVAKDLYAKEGAKVFMRGGAVSMLYTIVAYSAVSAVDHFVSTSIFPESKRPVLQGGMFGQGVTVNGAIVEDSLKQASPSSRKS
jgi:hypothetical protein